MKNSYLYNYNRMKGWFGRIGLTSSWGSLSVNLKQIQNYRGPDGKRTTFIWRNNGRDQYSMSEEFKDNPLDLSHYLLVRTREHIFM